MRPQHRKHVRLPLFFCFVIGFVTMAVGSASAQATFTVTNTNDFGAGSLRRAINDANTTAGSDFIVFDIPGPGPHTISPLAASPLPAITEAVDIDGYTQPGAAANTNPLTSCDAALGTDAVILIVIDGSLAGGNPGLVIQAPDCLVKGIFLIKDFVIPVSVIVYSTESIFVLFYCAAFYFYKDESEFMITDYKVNFAETASFGFIFFIVVFVIISVVGYYCV